MLIYIDPHYVNEVEALLVRIRSNAISESINHLNSAWKHFYPNYPLEDKFLDDELDKMYHAEQRLGHLLTYFSIIAIYIAYHGLFVLKSYIKIE